MNKKVDERMFGAVKALLKSGEKRANIADYMQVSTWTIGNIALCGSFREYQEMTEMRRQRRAEERAAIRAAMEPAEQTEQMEISPSPDVWAVTPDAVPAESIGPMAMHYHLNRLNTAMERQTELLGQIAEKLNFIVEMLS
jgi:hypothetical protein